MNTALQTTNGTGLSAGTLEGVVVGGDLSKLNSAQRLEWYSQRCNAAGLDPRTQPFQYLTLQGKLSLYATKAATDQLIANRCLTVQIISRGAANDLYEVVVRVTFADGHSVEDMAALSIAGLRGEALANATMKCVTKAKRRTVLSACGLGMLDESEAETIPNARLVSVDGEVIAYGQQAVAVHTEPHANASEQDNAMAAFGGQDNQPPQPKAEPEWEKANKRLRAIAAKLGKVHGLTGPQIGAYVSALIADRYDKDSATKVSPDQIGALADHLESGHLKLVPVLGVPDAPSEIAPMEAALIAERERAEAAQS